MFIINIMLSNMTKALKFFEGYIRESNSSDIIEGANLYPGYPPNLGTPNRVQFISGYLGSTGLNSGTINQNVNGSVTPASFYIGANPNYDIHIMRMTTVISGASCTHNRFGNINKASISNGWQLKLTENTNISYIANSVKTIGEMIVQLGANELFSAGNLVSIIPNYSGNEDGVILTVDFSRYIPYGLRVGRGNTDKLESIVNDDLSPLSQFKINISGFKNLPE